MRARYSIVCSFVFFSAGLAAGVAGCKSEIGGAPKAGAHLLVSWDSDLAPVFLSAGGRRADGANIPKLDVEAAMSVDPPGVRVQEINFEIDGLTREEDATLRVEGLDAEHRTIAVGEVRARLLPSQMIAASLRLFLPTTEEPNPPDPPPPNPDQPPIISVEHLAAETTASLMFVDVPGASLSLTPGSKDEHWLVFVSGVLSSSDPGEESAQLRVLINDVEVDLLGHQTRGDRNNGAGFMTFEVIGGTTAEQRIVPQFRAALGETSVSSLRVVAARIPKNADYHETNPEGILEASGTALEVAKLELQPSAPGEYLVLAKSSHREWPSDDTVQTWLEDQEGLAHPRDRRGARFSNGRNPWVPLYTSVVAPLDGSPVVYRIRGTSSGNLDLLEWWDNAWDFRAPLLDGAMNPLPVNGAPAHLTIDHASWVGAGRALADGSDLRILVNAGGVWSEVDRVLDPDSSWNAPDTTLWFSTRAGADDPTAVYYVYFGNALAGSAPDNPFEVYRFFDDFSGPLDGRWQVIDGLPNAANGQLEVPPGARLQSAAASTFGAGSILEARLALRLEPLDTGLDYLAFGGANDRLGQASWSLANGTHVMRSFGAETTFEHPSPDQSHRYAIDRRAGATVFSLDGASLAELGFTFGDPGPLPVSFANFSAGSTVRVDWVRAMADEPLEAIAGVVQAQSGIVPCQWQYRRIATFRLDAFQAAFHDYAPGLSNTMTAEGEVKNALDVPAPDVARWELSLQSMRIAGDADDNARRAGVLRADGDVLLRTAHKINKAGDALGGYHHIAGVARGHRTETATHYENAIASPDGITVEGADSAIVVLRY